MNTKKNIPDAETRARNVARLREVNLMLDHLNMKLELAQALAEADLQNSPLYVSRRERLCKELERQEQQKLVSQQD
jgi:hypothetical protein